MISKLSASLPTRVTESAKTGVFNYMVLTTGLGSVYGAYVTCLTTVNTTQAIAIQLSTPSQSGGDYNITVAIGLAGAEVEVFEYYFRAATTGQDSNYEKTLPIRIAAGTRIALKAMCGDATQTVRATVTAAED